MNDVVNVFKKEFLVQAMKLSIRATFHPFVAEKYCQQIDDVTHFVKWLETIQKSQT